MRRSQRRDCLKTAVTCVASYIGVNIVVYLVALDLIKFAVEATREYLNFVPMYILLAAIIGYQGQALCIIDETFDIEKSTDMRKRRQYRLRQSIFGFSFTVVCLTLVMNAFILRGLGVTITTSTIAVTLLCLLGTVICYVLMIHDDRKSVQELRKSASSSYLQRY